MGIEMIFKGVLGKIGMEFGRFLMLKVEKIGPFKGYVPINCHKWV